MVSTQACRTLKSLRSNWGRASHLLVPLNSFLAAVSPARLSVGQSLSVVGLCSTMASLSRQLISIGLPIMVLVLLQFICVEAGSHAATRKEDWEIPC